MITLKLKDKDILISDGEDNFNYKLNEEKEEIEIYKDDKFLGYVEYITCQNEEQFFKKLKDKLYNKKETKENKEKI